MQKCLILFATLVLAGCYHAQYKANYLDEFADLDCAKLNLERLDIESKLDPKWRNGYLDGNTANNVLNFSDSFRKLQEADPVWVGNHRPSPGEQRRQKRRMRYHAKWQALLQLQRSKGCINGLSQSPSLRIVPNEIQP